MLCQTSLLISLHGQQGRAPNTEKIQLEHYDQLSSKTDHALLKAVLQAALLKPKFWLWSRVWSLIRAVKGSRAWLEKGSTQQTTADFMGLAGVSPWLSHQSAAIPTHLRVRVRSAPAAVCQRCSSEASRSTDVVWWSLSPPLCSTGTGERVGGTCAVLSDFQVS